jgi:bifunctional DNA-binding transcriptional regulator/antitoxin component of YhaV-PrlF toxin-antitoxin module
MVKLSNLTPEGQVTIPRSIMKSINIDGGSDVLIEVQCGRLIIRKIEEKDTKIAEELICKAG